jgi:hypothetical protein
MDCEFVNWVNLGRTALTVDEGEEEEEEEEEEEFNST